ncbi:hypothetical protein, partial [uncultured Arcobacter sp.]|uniref:hypothetical protein n=1 Tax=uncultured Arcobacter sp. TaxID=165434 RepID=UPI002613A0C4
MKYFKLTSNTKKMFGKTLYQIEAVIDFNGIKKGQLGGFIDSEDNLAQDGSWVDNSSVVNNSRVDNSSVVNNSRVDNS